jgi:hypothetical protein
MYNLTKRFMLYTLKILGYNNAIIREDLDQPPQSVNRKSNLTVKRIELFESHS